MSYLQEQRRTLSFRRLPLAAKRRRARPALAMLGAMSRAARVLVPVLLLAGWLLTAPTFDLREVELRGGERVEREWIESRLGSAMASNMLLLDIETLRSALSEHPWIAELSVHKELPSRLVIEVVEHRPAAILETHAGRFLLSPLGRLIVAVDPGVTVPELVVRDDTATATETRASRWQAAIETSEQLQRLGPSWCRRPLRVRILSPEDFEVAFADEEFSLIVRAGEAHLQETLGRLAQLDELLPQLRDRLGTLRHADLRFDRRLVLAPGESGTTDPETGSARMRAVPDPRLSTALDPEVPSWINSSTATSVSAQWARG